MSGDESRQERSRPWGKTRSLEVALSGGLANMLLGALGPWILPGLALAAFLAAVLVFGIQIAGVDRPFRWIAWVCLLLSMLAISGVDLTLFGAAR